MAMLASGRRILDVIYYAMIMLHKQRNLEAFKFSSCEKENIWIFKICWWLLHKHDAILCESEGEETEFGAFAANSAEY